MNREPFDVFDHASDILNVIGKGILLTTHADGRNDTMTIGWGSIGLEWRMPIFTAYIRQSRYTQELLTKNPKFTVNIPLSYTPEIKHILSVCGTKSGRDINKFEECHLHLVDNLEFDVPAIAEFPITIECEILYRSLQKEEDLPQSIQSTFYQDHDDHDQIIGKIVKAYVLKP